MKVQTTIGMVDLDIYVDSFSAVDSYIKSGYLLDQNGEFVRELSDDELDLLEKECEGVVNEYAYSNGSKNHN